MRTPAALLSLLLLLAASAGAAEKPAFASAPAATSAGGMTTIAFTAKSPCPAAVWIEDAGGKVVRHLAAGMLGEKAPPPFRKGLAQKLEWDGKDDAGKAAPAGCSGKVGLGLEAKPAGFLGWDPATVGTVISTATDPKGNVYVMSHDDYPIRSTPVVTVFDAKGKYLRTLLPWPSTRAEAAKAYWLELSSGERIPRIHHLFQALYPLAPKQEKLTWENVVKICGEPLKLTPGGKAPKAFAGEGLFRPMHVVASRTRDEVFVREWAKARWRRYDGATGKATVLPLKEVGELAAAPDGTLYAHRGNSELVHLDRDGKQLAVLDAKILGTVRGGNYRGVRGLGVAPDGNVYLLHYSGRQGGSGKGLGKQGGDWSTVRLDVYSPDGKKKAESLLTLTAGDAGVRVAADGSIYVAGDVMPEDRPLPPEFAAVKGKDRCVYNYIYGSILKFGPKGGAVIAYRRGREKPPDGGVKGVNRHWSGTRQVRLTGDFKGFVTPVAPTGAGWGQCTCHGARFDLDAYGRVYAPEVTRFSVKVVDSAGNLLLRVGSYGNADEGLPMRDAGSGMRDGGASSSGTPHFESRIRFGWPAHVAVTGKAVYVSDMLNRRVVRLTLRPEVEKACPLR